MSIISMGLGSQVVPYYNLGNFLASWQTPQEFSAFLANTSSTINAQQLPSFIGQVQTRLIDAYTKIINDLNTRIAAIDNRLYDAQQKVIDGLAKQVQDINSRLNASITNVQQSLMGQVIPINLRLNEWQCKCERKPLPECETNEQKRNATSAADASGQQFGHGRTAQSSGMGQENGPPQQNLQLRESAQATTDQGVKHPHEPDTANALPNGEQLARNGHQAGFRAQDGGRRGDSADRTISQVITPGLGEGIPPYPCCDLAFILSKDGQQQLANYYATLGIPLVLGKEDQPFLEAIQEQIAIDDQGGKRAPTEDVLGAETQELD